MIPFASTRMTDEFAKDVAARKARDGAGNGKKGNAVPPSVDGLEQMLHPSNIAGMVGWLCHEHCTNEATLHEAGAGFFAQVRFERSLPLFATEKEGVVGAPTPEHVRDGQAGRNPT